VRTLWRSAAKAQWFSPSSSGHGTADPHRDDAAHESTDLQLLDALDLATDEAVSHTFSLFIVQPSGFV
jgi:hypothetical protein